MAEGPDQDRGCRRHGGTPRATGQILERGHPQHDGLSGDTEMKRNPIRAGLLLAMLLPCLASAQALDPNTLTLFKQPPGVWPTYNGDYSGRRFSELTQINQSNIDLLKIDWTLRLGVGPQRGVGGPTIKSTPLLVDGILYFTL